MSFFKDDAGQLLEAPTTVLTPEHALYSDDRASYTYPIEGWWWFDTEPEARAALGIRIASNV
jgi:hypothetical protein